LVSVDVNYIVNNKSDCLVNIPNKYPALGVYNRVLLCMSFSVECHFKVIPALVMVTLPKTKLL